MYKNVPHQRYQTVQVTSVDRGRLLVMLYDGCIKFLKLSKEGLEQKDPAKFARFLSKAQAIISELLVTLDFEKGGKIAQDLDRLYDFMLFHLTEANIEKNPAKIQNVINLVETVAAAYREIVEKQLAEKAEENKAAEPATKAMRPGQSISYSY